MKDYQYHIFSPYRVCPLGAHVDHQHGLVTGFAINKGVDLWWTPSGSPCLGENIGESCASGVEDVRRNGGL